VQSADDGGSYTCDDGDWVNADLVDAVEGNADVAP